MKKSKTEWWEDKLDQEFGGTYYHEESGYESPPHDPKGNNLTTDRGIKEELKTSQLKSFIRKVVAVERKKAIKDFEKEFIGLMPAFVNPRNKKIRQYINLTASFWKEAK